MAEMAYRREEDGTAPYWLAAVALAVILHVLVPCLLTLPSHSSALDPSDALAGFVTLSTEESAAAAVQAKASNPAKAVQPVEKSDGAAAISEPALSKPKPEAAKTPEFVPPAAEKPAAARTEIVLPAARAAFDNSPSTPEAPEKAYLSDRTSTAADRGPKNLPRGDPYLDKGQSNIVRALGVRGEGDLPAVPSEANSGSVKKEGSPDAGKGPEAGAEITKTQTIPDVSAPVPPAETKAVVPFPANKTQPPVVASTTPVLSEMPGTKTAPGDAAVLAANKPEKSNLPLAAVPPPTARADAAPAEKTAKTVTDLEAFKAILDNAGHGQAAGNASGDKPGVAGRPGQRGHEGDGTLRPGLEEAVSDVTTFNFDTSAAESAEARFAKHKDPVSAYFRPLVRRIDNKWKGEIGARQRLRPVVGEVCLRIVMRRDGKLLEAVEFSRLPKDLPDEFVAIAKIAVERATAPLSEPFPQNLADREKVEVVFGFVY